MVANDPNAQALGSKGGRVGSEAQKSARKLNMLKALAKRHPNSVKVRQELEKLERDASE